MATWKGDVAKPVVSISCITFNHEPFIEDALEGFLMQETDFPFEILIHDDASTDKTADIIREYEAAYPTIIKPIYQIENQYSQGKKPNVDFNFSRSMGEYIAYCEGDDYWTDKKKIQIQVDFLKKNLEYVLTNHSCVSISMDGLGKNFPKVAEKDFSQIELKKAPAIQTRTVCFRNCINSFPPEYHSALVEDLFIWSLLGSFGKSKFLDNIKPSYYRVHSGGIFSGADDKKRSLMVLSVRLSLLLYYIRTSDIDIAKYFAKLSVEQLLVFIGAKKFIELIYKITYNKVKRIILNIKV